MILKSVSLVNIRSYSSATVVFPRGIVLLSGDIGSGKSSVLSAIEFALFGVVRGAVSGEGLLRHGCRDGSVELCIELGGKAIRIKRTLKRGKDSVSQEAGSITIDGLCQPCSAVELKSKVLELLGYPAALLAKSKGLIYRYTVYTPQEDMKKILLEEPEARLATLRTVFNMDKYKRVQENAKVVSTAKKRDLDRIKGFLSDWEAKKIQRVTLEREGNDKNVELEKVRPELVAAQEALGLLNAQVNTLEEQNRMLISHKSKLFVIDNLIRMQTQNRIKAQMELDGVLANLAGWSVVEYDTLAHQEVKKRISDLMRQSVEFQTEQLRTKENIGTHRGHIVRAEDIIKKIGSIQNCPTCLQMVQNEHKQAIASDHEQTMAIHHEQIGLLEGRFVELSNKLTEIMDGIKISNELDKTMMALQAQHSHRKELVDRENRLRNELASCGLAIENAMTEKSTAAKAIFDLGDIEERYKQAKTRRDEAMGRERALAILHGKLNAELNALKDRMKSLDLELLKCQEENSKALKVQTQVSWIEDNFVPLMGNIESHVMRTIYTQFNDRFVQWLDALLLDSGITARLDEAFTPQITQQGFDVPIEFLSGGEKTSCALAYRLALNKVINDVVESIKTKDLLILDEPTDGFSSEQLDKVRDVLHELGLAQIILVSHEQKIESFVDSVIRITKEEGESRVG